MSALIENQAKRWTYEEYYKLQDDQRYEIIDGALLMSPAPDTWHQSWLNSLNILMSLFVRRTKFGRIFISPVDVVLDPANTVQPDIVFIGAKNLGIVQKQAILGVPDLVVELISSTSVRRDRYVKKELYERFGVAEYWIGDAANQSLEILTLREGRYQLHSSAEVSGRASSLVLSGLEFDLAEIEQ